MGDGNNREGRKGRTDKYGKGALREGGQKGADGKINKRGKRDRTKVRSPGFG